MSPPRDEPACCVVVAVAGLVLFAGLVLLMWLTAPK